MIIFLDTVGVIALWDTKDQWHHDAVAAEHHLVAEDVTLVTTQYVLAEVANAASRKRYRGHVVALRQQLEVNHHLIAPNEADWSSAWLAYSRGEAGDAGLVDHLSFQVMRRLGITRAFTNDLHFRAAGFEPLF